MCDFASNSDITEFLENAKNLITAGDFDFVPRRKNMQALAKYGLTIPDAKEALLELVVTEYYKGPKKDFTYPGDIWEFKKTIQGKLFYIKMKIVIENNKNILKCLGFHEDDFS